MIPPKTNNNHPKMTKMNNKIKKNSKIIIITNLKTPNKKKQITPIITRQ